MEPYKAEDVIPIVEKMNSRTRGQTNHDNMNRGLIKCQVGFPSKDSLPVFITIASCEEWIIHLKETA